MARGLVLAISATAIVAVISLAFESLGKTAPEFKPAPSGGIWPSEEDFVGADVEIDDTVPSATTSTSMTPSSKL